MKLIESKTYLNLAKAYAGECQARTRYEFIEYGARKEGYKALADIIDTIAYNEFNHSRMFYSFIESASKEIIDNIDICSGYPFKEKWNLVENLALAAEDEKIESTMIYPEYAATAKAEGFQDIADLFTNIAGIENCHHLLFADLHRQFRDGTAYSKPVETKWKCGGCGYEHTSKTAFEVCPVCLEKQGVVLLQVASD